MPNNDIFDSFHWHSSIGIDFALDGNRRFVSRLPNSKRARSMFADAGNNMLIHKTSRCLWRISDDKKSIEPVFGTDVLTDDDVMSAMKEES
jgi:hypothetical protein